MKQVVDKSFGRCRGWGWPRTLVEGRRCRTRGTSGCCHRHADRTAYCGHDLRLHAGAPGRQAYKLTRGDARSGEVAGLDVPSQIEIAGLVQEQFFGIGMLLKGPLDVELHRVVRRAQAGNRSLGGGRALRRGRGRGGGYPLGRRGRWHGGRRRSWANRNAHQGKRRGRGRRTAAAAAAQEQSGREKRADRDQHEGPAQPEHSALHDADARTRCQALH